VEIDLGPAYEQLFGRYVELCALSQYRSFEHGEGGVPGHAVMYLKGACKDESAGHPSLRRCRSRATTRDDPEHGAGISVNRYFGNVNWIAIPSRSLFFDGNLEEGAPLDQAAFDRTLQDSFDSGVFEGVEILPSYPTPNERSLEDFVATNSLATDFALRFSRTVHCARMPIREEMLSDIVDYLNQVNLEYAAGLADYSWSGYSDNCVHLLRNALAAASIWRPISVNDAKLRQLANLAVPANEFVNLADLGANGPLADGREVYRNDEARDALLDFDWLPRRHGAIVTIKPVHVPNELYDTAYRMFVLDNPLTFGVTKNGLDLIDDPRFTDLQTNLEHFRGVYEAILARGEDLIAGGFLPLRGIRYLRPTRRYYGYVEAQLEEVNLMLEHLAGKKPRLGSGVGFHSPECRVESAERGAPCPKLPPLSPSTSSPAPAR
jgi:hypothetical protein